MPNNIPVPSNAHQNIIAIINGLNDSDLDNTYLSGYFPTTSDLILQHWGLSNNSYFNNENLGKDLNNTFKNTPAINDPDLNKVLNYSTFNHYIDGFKYFKSFLKSIVSNDFKIAAHLLYYAEFRWLNCLLSSNGIFCIDNVYLYSTNQGIKKFDIKKIGSHQGMWYLFEYWCKTNEADNLFKNSFSVHGVSITDWMSSANLISQTTSPKILSDLIYNLTNVNKMNYLADRDFRNKASYDGLSKPTAFNDLDLKFTFNFLNKHYNGLLSLDSDNDFFELLDLEVLKILFSRKVNQSSSSNKLRKCKRKQINRLYKAIQNACINLNKTSLFGNTLLNSIVKENIFESLLLKQAEEDDNEALLKVFYRALLLMKLSSSSIKHLIKDAGLTADALRPWFLTKLKHSYWLKNLELEEYSDIEEISLNSRLDYYLSYSDQKEDFESMATNNSINDLWDIDESRNLDILKLTDIDIASIWSLT